MHSANCQPHAQQRRLRDVPTVGTIATEASSTGSNLIRTAASGAAAASEATPSAVMAGPSPVKSGGVVRTVVRRSTRHAVAGSSSSSKGTGGHEPMVNRAGVVPVAGNSSGPGTTRDAEAASAGGTHAMGASTSYFASSLPAPAAAHASLPPVARRRRERTAAVPPARTRSHGHEW